MSRFLLAAICLCGVCASIMAFSPIRDEAQLVRELAPAERSKIVGGDIFCYSDTSMTDCPAGGPPGTLISSCASLTCTEDGAGGWRCPGAANPLEPAWWEAVVVHTEWSQACTAGPTGYTDCTTVPDWYCQEYRGCNGACGDPDPVTGARACSAGSASVKLNGKQYKIPSGGGCDINIGDATRVRKLSILLATNGFFTNSFAL